MEQDLGTYCVTNMVQRSSLLEGSSSCANDSSRWTTSLPNHIEPVGLAENVKQIKGWILAKNDESQRVGIVGMGGLGKTTIAKEIYKDQELKNRFKKKIWVSVSQPVDTVRIMRTILDELEVKGHSSDSLPATLLKDIKEALAETTYLIIMDDVWSQILQGLTQDGRYNSCIIITTRKEDVARNMGVGELRIHRPNLLGDPDSWSLLCKVAFSSPNGTCPNPELEEVGKNIVKKCGGLPLAIKATAGLLSTKSRSLSEWQKIHEDFRAKLAEIASDGNSVITSLQLSYDDLPSHLKQCIQCFSIYPEDFEIQTEQLVYWWAGEGFVVSGNNRTAIQLGYDCLYELISRRLIEYDRNELRTKFSRVRFKICKMHDTVRDMIIKVAKQDAFSSFNDSNGQIFDKDTRHFGITEKSGSIQPTNITNSKIRGMLKTYVNVDSKLDLILPKVNLRVLDLFQCDLRSVEEFERWVKYQKRLAYLNLYGSELHGDPTEFIKDLHNLQYLVTNTVKSVSSLAKLRVLKLHPGICFKHPEGLANLINLEELSGIMLGDPSNRGGTGGGCSLGEIIGLPKLIQLEVGIGDPIDADVLACELSVVSGLRHIEVLSIDLNHSTHELLDQLAPPQSLQDLRIIRIGGETMPGFIKPELLPKLRRLTIEDSDYLTHMGPSFWGEEKTWKLHSLSLIKLSKLDWVTEREMVPSVKRPLIECVEETILTKNWLNNPFLVQCLYKVHITEIVYV
ncbi:hypothetical protein MKW92_029228 [Papaver armeniacum]|nr:hypothetical protein MKW92_029228 [Papaver armeniacum]